MRRQHFQLRLILTICAVIAGGQFVALQWLAPHYMVRAMTRLSGDDVVFVRAGPSFPFLTTLSGFRLASNTVESAFSIQRLVMSPRWFSFTSRTLWLDRLELTRPLLRVSRTKGGALFWPAVAKSHGPAGALALLPQSWQIHVNALTVTDGVLELLDETPATPFHGAMDHISLVIGPVTIASDGTTLSILPMRGKLTSFAVRGKLIGYEGISAPTYCSGWVDRIGKHMGASCRLEPLPLKAFDPYYHGTPALRVYTTTLKSTAELSAHSNRFDGRIQFELDNLSEGDLSIRGRTLLDVKEILGGGGEPRLSGEVSLNGPFDTPSAWQAEFLPGDDGMQAMVTRLLEYQVARIRVAVGRHQLLINMSPATEATMTDIEMTSRAVIEALEILTSPPEPPVEVEPEAAPAAEPEAPEAGAPTQAQPES